MIWKGRYHAWCCGVWGYVESGSDCCLDITSPGRVVSTKIKMIHIQSDHQFFFKSSLPFDRHLVHLINDCWDSWWGHTLWNSSSRGTKLVSKASNCLVTSSFLFPKYTILTIYSLHSPSRQYSPRIVLLQSQIARSPYFDQSTNLPAPQENSTTTPVPARR